MHFQGHFRPPFKQFHTASGANAPQYLFYFDTLNKQSYDKDIIMALALFVFFECIVCATKRKGMSENAGNGYNARKAEVD